MSHRPAIRGIDRGQSVLATATFRKAGVLTNPTTVTFTVLAPDGTETDYTDQDEEVENPSTGVYTLAVAAAADDRYQVRVKSTGTVQAATSGVIDVEADDFS